MLTFLKAILAAEMREGRWGQRKGEREENLLDEEGIWEASLGQREHLKGQGAQ